jgi:peroxiredoxin
MKRWICATVILLLLASMVGAANPPMLKIGEKAPDFSLPGVDGKNYSLKDFGGAKILVIIFTCNHCPTAQAYEARIKKLHADYKDKGVALVAISPNDPLAVRLDELGYTEYNDSLEEMKLRAKDQAFAFPYLYDGETQETSRAYGVVATPHVYIFDQERTLRYVGRIDDSEVKQVTSQDARNALDALLAGRPVPVESTKVFGCSTKWADKREDAKRSLAKWDAEPVKIAAINAEAVKALAKNDSKKLRLINVWATWCGPCVNELPELVTMNRMYRKRPFELITISIDDLKKQDQALEMLQKLQVSTTNYIFSSDKKDALVEALDPKWPGPVPHTILIEPGGKIIYRQTGEFDALELKKAIVGYLGRTY